MAILGYFYRYFLKASFEAKLKFMAPSSKSEILKKHTFFLTTPISKFDVVRNWGSKNDPPTMDLFFKNIAVAAAATSVLGGGALSDKSCQEMCRRH